MEQDERVAPPRGKLTVRACRWAIEQIRREHASVNGIRRQLGTSWSAVWAAVKPLLQQAADQESRFDGVRTLGVDEHVWHHVSTKPIEDGGRGPKELTGMVDLTRHLDKDGNLVVRHDPTLIREEPLKVSRDLGVPVDSRTAVPFRRRPARHGIHNRSV